MNPTFFGRAGLPALFAALTLVCSAAFAASPATVLLEGAMHSQGGGAAADGNYNFTFTIYDKQAGGTAAWTEGPATVALQSGRFSYALGSKTKLDAAKLAALDAQWLGIKVGSDPELARFPLHATAFALHAATAGGLACDGCVGADTVANGSISALKVNFAYAAAANGIKGGDAKAAQALNCTGCVSVAHMKFDSAVDLGSNPLTAGKITSSGDILAKGTVAATAFTGDGSGLTGIKVPSGDCPSGQVVNGIDGNGKLKCAKVGGDLDGVSGKSLSQHFTDTITGSKNLDIPDFDSNGLLDGITLPDVGVAESFDVKIEITKEPFIDEKPKDGKTDYDTTDLTVVLFPPLLTKPLPAQRSNMVDAFLTKPSIDGQIYPHYVLHQGTGAGLVSLIASYPTATKPVAGDLSTWIGKNPKGLWQLLILDNTDRVDAKGDDVKTDGKLVTWSITFQTVSGSQITLNGSQFTTGTVWGGYKGHDGKQLGDDLKVGAGVKVGDSETACDGTTAGTVRWNSEFKSFQGCNGTAWENLNDATGLGKSRANPGKTCKDIKTRDPGSKSGHYWVDPDGAGKGLPPWKTYCEQTRDGGGWMLGITHWYNDQFQAHGGWTDENGDIMTAPFMIGGASFKHSDTQIRAAMGGGSEQNFDVMFDQAGVNRSYSWRNFEYIILRNYTVYWRFDIRVAESKTVTKAESWDRDTGDMLWTGRPVCGSTHGGGKGINCYNVYGGSTNPDGGKGCKVNKSRNNWSGVLHLYMSEHNTDTYMYVCNGAQHSSTGRPLTHRYWFRERN